MKLPKVSGNLILPSVTTAIVTLMAIWLGIVIWWRRIPVEFWGEVRLLYNILVFGCLFFFAGAIYIHGVTNKHSRVIVAARVLGTIGAFAAILGLALHISPIGIVIPLTAIFMAIGGVALAQARPKVAGVLMLLAGIISAIVYLMAIVFMEPIYDHLHPEVAKAIGISAAATTLFASFFLIPAGTVALASLIKPPSDKWVTIILGVMAIFTSLGIISIFSHLFGLLLPLFLQPPPPPPFLPYQ